MLIDELRDLLFEVNVNLRVMDRLSLNEIEPDLSSRQEAEIRERKESLYNQSIELMKDFLKKIEAVGNIPFCPAIRVKIERTSLNG
jgi:hypothetical protein